MRRFTTSAGTDRSLLGLLLVAEAVAAVILLAGHTPAEPAAHSSTAAPPASTVAATGALTVRALPDGRAVRLVRLGGTRTASLVERIAAQMAGAADAVTAFWGPAWRHEVLVVVAATDAQFTNLGGGGADIAATTTVDRITFAPGAAAMTDDDLRIVLRHELFHFAARQDTAADAPRWLTEGVADFVARPPQGPASQDAAAIAVLPTDAELDTAGATRSRAYDRAWWFSRYVAERYGSATLRALYLRACGARHPDVDTAVRETLHADVPAVLAGWRHWLAFGHRPAGG